VLTRWRLGEGMKESEIRSAEAMERLIALCAEDAETFFVGQPRHDLPCPACDCHRVTPAFVKNTFGFVVCDACGSLFQSPRPPLPAFTRFYQEGASNQYLFKTFYPMVADARREKLFRPRVREVARLLAEDLLSPRMVGEVGAGYGLFLEEWERQYPGATLTAIEPNGEMAEVCRGKGFEVIQCMAEEIAGQVPPFDLLVAFEVIEHAYDPFRFCQALRRNLGRKGRLLLTGLTVDGFDIQVLWDKAQIVAPANHLNFLSVKGFEEMLKRAGFTNVNVFTPGKLDVEIVRRTVAGGEALPPEMRFIQKLLGQDAETLAAFQGFLSQHKLSSHCWAWASVD